MCDIDIRDFSLIAKLQPKGTRIGYDQDGRMEFIHPDGQHLLVTTAIALMHKPSALPSDK
jgi:hypothetical protein